MEILLSYFIIGLFGSAIATAIQCYRYQAEASFVGFIISIVIWPIYVLAVIVSIIKNGW